MGAPLPAPRVTLVPAGRLGRFARAAVATANPLASEAAARVLAEGGNAADAAIAAAFVLGVAEPQSSGIGGGGFLLYFEARTGAVRALDYRERAPRRAHRRMFRRRGRMRPRLAVDGHLAVAVPGTVAGLAEAHRALGRLPWRRLVDPAARIAEQGYEVRPRTAAALRDRAAVLRRYPASAREFFPLGRPPRAGERLRHPDLARTLRAIAEGGARVFYQGEIARRIAAEMRRGGGLVDEEDLRGYRAIWREPLRARWRDVEVASFPLPSSGGVHLVQMLNILERDDLRAISPATRAHLFVEAMRRAYADRATHLGDPAFHRVPLRGLLSKRYAAALRAGIDLRRATPSRRVRAGDPRRFESPSTSHLGVVDAEGNVVALTQSLNYGFGSGVVVPGTGILLNDTMDDFAIAPGRANLYGLVGGEANAVAPGKTPLSSMMPTLVLRRGRAFLALGGSGGSRIITAVLQVLIHRVALAMDLAAAVSAPRLHHQWLPDDVQVEPAMPAQVLAGLERRGHRLRAGPLLWRVQAVEIADDGTRLAVADPRGDGAAAGF
jgi:gamma-glutamyltranspeptidase/glutathione hydrolase